MGNCESNSGGTPSLVLYPGYKSFRNDSTTWSVATPMWVAPRSSMDRTEVRTPRTAPISWPFASFAAGTAKKCRNNSYVPSIRYTSMRLRSVHFEFQQSYSLDSDRQH